MFASRTKKTVEVDGVNVVIRKLSARSLEKAVEARQIASAQLAQTFGPDLMRVFREGEAPQKLVADDEDVSPEMREQARLAMYDRAAVLVAGVESWDARDEGGKPITVSAGLDDLDESAATTLHKAILDLSLGPSDPKLAEEERGKL